MQVPIERVDAYLTSCGGFNVYRTNCDDQVRNGAKALTELGYWGWIRRADPSKGFCLSSSKKAADVMRAVAADGHSGATFGCMMRVLQAVASKELPPDGGECSVCLSSGGETSELDCGHAFHTACIRQWAGNTCPLCRQNTVPQP